MKRSDRLSSLRLGARRLGALQVEVMETTWSADDWLTPGRVLELMEVDRAYTTIMTVLARLAEQGILERRRIGRAFEYRPVISREEFYAQRLSEVLRDSTELESTLAGFVAGLSSSQRQELAGLLGRSDSSDAGNGA